MTKKEIRQAIWKSLTERPKKWAQVVDRAIWLGVSGWLAVTSFVTYQAGLFLVIVVIVIIGFLVMYWTAKGR